MANIKVAGNAIVLESSVTLEDWKLLKKYRPEAMKLFGGEDGKDEVFAVFIGAKGNGDISNAGVKFAPTSNNGLATVTLTPEIPDGIAVKDFIADTYGKAILSLNKIEDGVTDAIEEVSEERTTILENITIA